MYDMAPHQQTKENGQSASVKLSNRGLELYSSFDDVVILTTCHRLRTMANPKNEDEREANERAKRFIQILHRLRAMKWAIED